MRLKTLLLLAMIFAIGTSQAKSKWFNPDQLTTAGAYYYPEHWDSTQWDRDLEKMAELGFEFTHYAEFAWAQLEPEEGKYDFAWLDKAVELAAKHNLKVIMCTSTATPPVWLVRKYPEILTKNEDGTQMDHGSRQHASFSNQTYRDYALKMIAELAKHYGNDKRIMGWQLDNEPKINFDHNPEAQQRFRRWLKDKYSTISVLNKEWGTAFWSQVYNNFSQINIPLLKQWGMNSHQILDYRRFIADETATFLDDQAVEIRKHIKQNQWVTTNYIPAYEDGHIARSKELDYHCYTRYMVYGENYGIGRKGYRVGPVERIAMANDYFRPIDGTYGVMELQPGQVNWGQINPQPFPGAVRMWLWHVFAGGSDLVCTYRFRQPLYGTELYHYGIVSSDGVTVTSGGLEYKQFIDEIAQLRELYNKKATQPNSYLKRKTAIVYNVENSWGMGNDKQTSLWNTMQHIRKYYSALKSFGAPVDFVSEEADLSDYGVVVVPAFQQVTKALIAKWEAYAKNGGTLVMSCRTGHKKKNGQLWETQYGQPIFNLIGAEIEFYDHLLPHTKDEVIANDKAYKWRSWAEILAPKEGSETWATYKGDFYAGKPAVVHHRYGKGTVTYIGADSDKGDLEKAMLQNVFAEAQISIMDLPAGVNVEYRDGFGIAVNYSDKPFTFPLTAEAKIVLGEKEIQPVGVLVWQVP